HTHTHTRTHSRVSHSPSLSFFLSFFLSCSHSVFSRSHPHTLMPTPSLPICRDPGRILTYAGWKGVKCSGFHWSASYTHTLFLSLSLSFSFSYTHTHTQNIHS